MNMPGRIMGNLSRLSVVPGTGEVKAFSTLSMALIEQRSDSRRRLKMELLPTFVVPIRYMSPPTRVLKEMTKKFNRPR